MSSVAKLTLGPVLFNWTPETLRDFYFRVADEAPVDTVHLGEVVCSKRTPFFAPHVAEVAERLTAAGKEVVLSTLALIMDKREMQGVRDTVGIETGGIDTGGLDGFLIEANDVSAISLLAGRPHVVGPLVNVYNEGTLAYLERMGAARICLPPELSGEILAILARSAKAELEVLAFGRLPLAISARCYHARSRNLHKDGCQYVCAEDPDGLEVDTLEGTPFLTVNGTQTMSYHYVGLLHELAALRAVGINRFRLSPHAVDMVGVARVFRDVLDGAASAAEGCDRLAALAPDADFANGYLHGREGHALVDEMLTLD